MKERELSLELDMLKNSEGASCLLTIPTATLIKCRSTGGVSIPY
jgi:hypothetical protein